MNEFDEELQRITDLLGQYRNEDLMDDSQWMSPHDAREAIKQAIEKHIIGEDVELIVPLPGIDNHNAVQRHIGGNQVREQQRKKLRS